MQNLTELVLTVETVRKGGSKRKLRALNPFSINNCEMIQRETPLALAVSSESSSLIGSGSLRVK